MIHTVPGLQIWLHLEQQLQQQNGSSSSNKIDSDIYAKQNFNSDRYSYAVTIHNNNNHDILSSTTPLHSTFTKSNN